MTFVYFKINGNYTLYFKLLIANNSLILNEKIESRKRKIN